MPREPDAVSAAIAEANGLAVRSVLPSEQPAVVCKLDDGSWRARSEVVSKLVLVTAPQNYRD